MISLMYVSQCTLQRGKTDEAVADIVQRSISRNAALDVTGALIFTGAHFAQALEGSARSVDELMLSICRDERHRHVTIVDRSQIVSRRFTNWQLAYQGPSTYVGRPIENLVDSNGLSSSRDVERVYELLSHFAG